LRYVVPPDDHKDRFVISDNCGGISLNDGGLRIHIQARDFWRDDFGYGVGVYGIGS